MADAGKRLDVFLAEKTGFSRSHVNKLIKSGAVFRRRKAGYQVKEGEKVIVENCCYPEAAGFTQPMPKVVYEDDFLLVFNKPAGLVVPLDFHHPASTLADYLHEAYPQAEIVHRLDKDTSGVILVAKDQKTAEILRKQFQERQIKKEYLALVTGKLEPEQGIIKAPLSRSLRDRQKIDVSASLKAKAAITKYQVKSHLGKFTLAKVEILTGRTHQIRVHFGAIGFPVAGDKTYGNKKINESLKKKAGLSRQFLHAEKITFSHPATGKQMVVKAPLPSDLKSALAKLKSDDSK